MLRHIIRHINLLVLTLLVLSIFSFSLVYLFPGDPLINLSGIRTTDEQVYASLVARYQFDHNVGVQYLRYMALLLDGDWGRSFSSGLPLWSEITQSLPASIELSAYALLLSLIMGIPLGFIAGLRYHKATDYGILGASVVGYSLPVFWLALLLILIFSLQLGLLPLSGRMSLIFDVPHHTGFILLDIWLSDIPHKTAAYYDAFAHMALPTLSITIVTTAIVIRLTRRSIVEVMPKEFILAAYTRGLSRRHVFWRHAVRNALLPIIPMLAMQSTALLTNAMIVEVIYSWPGIGNWLIQAIYQRDFPAIRAGMLAVSAVVIILTITVDLFAKLIDPNRDRKSRVTT